MSTYRNCRFGRLSKSPVLIPVRLLFAKFLKYNKNPFQLGTCGHFHSKFYGFIDTLVPLAKTISLK